MSKAQRILEKDPQLQAHTFSCRFLEPGVVSYDEDGMILIQTENLMNIANAFEGYPVVIDHKDVDSDNAQEIVCGYISKVWKNEEDGWAWCTFLLDNKSAIDLINAGHSVSCAYVPTRTLAGGVYHNIKYDREIVEGRPLHLAIVSNPRYEGAKIIKNSKGENMTFKFFRNKKEEVKDIENAVLEVDGEEVSISEAVTSFKNAKKNKKTKMNGDDEVGVDGEMVKVSDLAASYKADKSKKNSEKEIEEEEEDDVENETKDEEEEEGKNQDAKKAKKNSVSDEDRSDEDFKKIKNSKAKAEERELENQKFLNSTKEKATYSPSVNRIEKGQSLYGSSKS